MLEGYGLTETAPMITYHPFDWQKIGSVGRVFDDIQIRFEEDGEIVVKGPNLMTGYWNRPDATAEVLKDGWYSTGDLGVLDKDGFLYLTGRKKELIILGNGKNVRPDLIELKIRESFPLVEDIAVTHKDGRLVAIVKPDIKEAKRLGVVNLTETIKWKVIDLYNQKVENYKKIHDIIITNDDIPRTRMGKVKRYLLASFLDGKESEKKASEAAPDFEEYAIVEKLVQQASGRKPNPSDHLEIDLGLDSLSLVELQFGIEKSFGMNFADGELAKYQTVRELAEAVQTKKTTISREEINWKEILSEDNTTVLPKKIWILRLFRFIFNALFTRRLSLKVTGTEKIPAGACIIASNHESFLDSLVLSSHLSRSVLNDLFFFAKEKNFNFAFARILTARAHIIIMDLNRNLADSLRMIASVLRMNKKVLIFPEGARSRDGKLQHFKKSFAIISKELDVPVVPVAINGTFESLPINSKFPAKGHVTVEFLDPIYPAQLDEQGIMDSVRSSIEKKLIK
jgi:long-chain acyl-CoA synthetase